MFSLFPSSKKWYRVCLPEPFPKQNICRQEIGGKPVVFSIQSNGLLIAFNDHCPHAGYSLSEENQIVNGRIICALHGYKFDVRSGACIGDGELRLKKYKTEKRGDDWWVEL